jgi:glutaredoxin
LQGALLRLVHCRAGLICRLTALIALLLSLDYLLGSSLDPVDYFLEVKVFVLRTCGHACKFLPELLHRKIIVAMRTIILEDHQEVRVKRVVGSVFIIFINLLQDLSRGNCFCLEIENERLDIHGVASFSFVLIYYLEEPLSQFGVHMGVIEVW